MNDDPNFIDSSALLLHAHTLLAALQQEAGEQIGVGPEPTQDEPPTLPERVSTKLWVPEDQPPALPVPETQYDKDLTQLYQFARALKENAEAFLMLVDDLPGTETHHTRKTAQDAQAITITPKRRLSVRGNPAPTPERLRLTKLLEIAKQLLVVTHQLIPDDLADDLGAAAKLAREREYQLQAAEIAKWMWQQRGATVWGSGGRAE